MAPDITILLNRHLIQILSRFWFWPGRLCKNCFFSSSYNNQTKTRRKCQVKCHLKKGGRLCRCWWFWRPLKQGRLCFSGVFRPLGPFLTVFPAVSAFAKVFSWYACIWVNASAGKVHPSPATAITANPVVFWNDWFSTAVYGARGQVTCLCQRQTCG